MAVSLLHLLVVTCIPKHARRIPLIATRSGMPRLVRFYMDLLAASIEVLFGAKGFVGLSDGGVSGPCSSPQPGLQTSYAPTYNSPIGALTQTSFTQPATQLPTYPDVWRQAIRARTPRRRATGLDALAVCRERCIARDRHSRASYRGVSGLGFSSCSSLPSNFHPQDPAWFKASCPCQLRIASDRFATDVPVLVWFPTY